MGKKINPYSSEANAIMTTRLQFALKETEIHHWKLFENLASAFLSKEFPNLRTMASPGGDGGRDAELFVDESEPSSVLQYSVTKDWGTKIKGTVARLKKTKPEFNYLVYVTSQVIGAKADDLKAKMRKENRVALDVRDANWFTENVTDKTIISVEEYCRAIVDPILNTQGIDVAVRPSMNSGEAKAALLFLEMLWQDEKRDKGLTKMGYDAFVRAALRDSRNDRRIAKSEIIEFVKKQLHSIDEVLVKRNCETAINRLVSRKVVHHFTKTDDYCLSHDESRRYETNLIKIRESEDALTETIKAKVSLYLSDDTLAKQLKGGADDFAGYCRTVIDKFLSDRAAALASGVLEGEVSQITSQELERVVRNTVTNGGTRKYDDHLVRGVVTCCRDLLNVPDIRVNRYLEAISDSYTLFTLFQQSDDAQAITNKFFVGGSIWLDTSIILPLIAESLYEPEFRTVTTVLNAAKSAGTKFFVTDGVIEEIERHLNRCTTYVSIYQSSGDQIWRGNRPYLIQSYLLQGRKIGGFRRWAESFVGEIDQQRDLKDYLSTVHAIAVANLEEACKAVSDELRIAVTEFWNGVHEGRRSRDDEGFDQLAIQRLARHDAENFVGVVARRKSAPSATALGYPYWWLTFDSEAFHVLNKISKGIEDYPRHSPVMSPDFLLTYLRFGPSREKNESKHLPVMMEFASFADLPPDLISALQEIRESNRDFPEHVIQRKLRDRLDELRARPGAAVSAGLNGLTVNARRG